MSRFNLKLRKVNYLPGSYDVGRFQDENVREIFQVQLNIKLKSPKLDNVEDGWNNFRKIICEVADGVLGGKLETQLRILVKMFYV